MLAAYDLHSSLAHGRLASMHAHSIPRSHARRRNIQARRSKLVVAQSLANDPSRG